MPSNKKLLQAAAGSAGGDNLYVEDVFSTYLYTGNNSSQTITNNIDLAGEGGLVWFKRRSTARTHILIDTERGKTSYLQSNETVAAETGITNTITSFNSDGFSISDQQDINGNAETVASFTFRKAEKFFDVVTYTGTGSQRTVSHNLGSVPRMMIIKKTNGTGGWWVYSKDWVDANSGSLGVALNLSNSDAGLTGYDTDFFWGANPTDSVFSVGTYNGTNGNNDTFVAYLFASDAGGFGDDDENIIKCGSYDANLGEVVNLGFEPQFIIYKSTASGAWRMADTMRGWTANDTNTIKQLFPNLTNAESDNTFARPTPTGFIINQSGGGQKHIYIAIRRPMKTPESGTEVFNPTTAAVHTDITNNFAADLWFGNNTSGDGGNNAHTFASRLTGLKWLQTATTSAESTTSNTFYWDSNTEFTNNQFGGSRVEYFLKRATGFFDVVAYTGNGSGSGQVINHNLGVTPEIIIIKGRSNSGRQWHTYVASQGQDKALFIESNGAEQANTALVGGTINSTQYELKVDFGNVNGNGETYISYLFATLAGVSKVGSYTGTGSDLNVDCGFSAGARFILIKRSDSTGDWYFWDSARGITAGNDPYLLLNTTAAEVTNTDYIDPLSSGFTVTSTAPAGLNASGGSYIFLAIA
jgi:hypothetical protein